MEKSLIGSHETDGGAMKGVSVSDSRPANGGHGSHSYSRNSHYQKSFADIEKKEIEDEIIKNFNTRALSSTSNTIRLADMGCATGPNTFWTMQNIIQAMKLKFQSQCPDTQTPHFQVFFNDQISNDFNTLFQSLPPERDYFAAAVPGSFHGRLFPDSSLHFVHSAYSIHWLSMSPEELRDEKSPAWNKGRIHYVGASEEVVKGYEAQFAKDMKRFLDARAKEVVPGGMMVIIASGVPDGMASSDLPFGILYDSLASALMDMSKEGLLHETQIDSFNLPIYVTCPSEMTKMVGENGCFSIERMELAEPATWLKGSIDIREWINHVRAAMEGTFIEHFAKMEIIDEMFERVITKLSQCSEEINAKLHEKVQLFTILKRKEDDDEDDDDDNDSYA